jgi:hypothetical protein
MAFGVVARSITGRRLGVGREMEVGVRKPDGRAARRGRLLRVGLVVLSAYCVAASARAAEPSLEFAVKAAYLYKFGAFIEWPNTAFESDNSPANLCVVGEDPFGPVLDKAVDEQRIGNRAIVVRRLKAVARDSGCQILFVDGSDAQRVSQTLEAVRGESVLTITDGAKKPEATGIINFVIADNKVRFEIDDQAASHNKLTISSKLLGLAKSTKRRE